MCSPHDSSGWIKDWQAMYPQIQNKNLKSNQGWDNKGQNHGAATIGTKTIPFLARTYGAGSTYPVVLCWR